MYRSPPLGVCGVSSARNAWEAVLVPGPKRRFCLTSSAVTQSTPNRTSEEVIGSTAGHDRKGPCCRTLLTPPRVLPVIMTCGNMDFSALFPDLRSRSVPAAGIVCAIAHSMPPPGSDRKIQRKANTTPGVSRDGSGMRQTGIATRMTRPPPSRGTAEMVPPWARATDRAMDRPSPTPLSLPVRSVRSRRNGSKRLSIS